MWFQKAPIRVAVYGSCHAGAIKRVLAGVRGLGRRIEFVPLPAVMDITAEEMTAFVADLPTIDLFLYQPISASYRGPEFASARVVEAAGPRTMLLSFAYYHFEVYTPFVTSALPGLPEPPTEYMDYLLGALIARGFSDAEIAQRLLHLEGLEPYVEGMLAAAFYEFGVREERVLEGDRPLDIRISSRVKAAFRSERLGHTPNHPAAQVLNWIADDVLTHLRPLLGKDFAGRGSNCPDPLEDIQFFAPPFVQRAFGLTFEDAPRVVIKDRAMTLDGYIRDQRPFYEAIPRQTFLDAVEVMAQPSARPWYTPLLTTT